MDWRCKAFVQTGLSLVPRGCQLNYALQKFVTKTAAPRPQILSAKVANATRHLSLVSEQLGDSLSSRTFYEFGAGRELCIPLAFYSMGVEEQIVVDIRRLASPEMVNAAIEAFRHVDMNIGFQRKPVEKLEDERALYESFVTSLKRLYGIDYRAPYDARRTDLSAGSVDVITSTNVLQHVPVDEIRAILMECGRLLRTDGVMSCRIDYHDNYYDFDRSISPYNFLRYSDSRWAIFSPDLHYQNRLRHPDYLQLFESCGFRVLREDYRTPTKHDLAQLSRVPIDSQFARYTPEELAIGYSFLVARKADSQTENELP